MVRRSVDLTVTQGNKAVKLHGNTVKVEEGGKVVYKKKFEDRQSATEEFEKQQELHIKSAICPKLEAKIKKDSGPDPEGCAGGHCPVR